MKDWEIVTKPKAKEDIREIWLTISDDNPHAADAFEQAVDETANLLSSAPESGSKRYFYHPELEGLRFFPIRGFENHLLFYRTLTEEETIEIVRVVHGTRNIPTLFDEEKN
jgi:toxin ParE1/3/4